MFWNIYQKVSVFWIVLTALYTSFKHLWTVFLQISSYLSECFESYTDNLYFRIFLHSKKFITFLDFFTRSPAIFVSFFSGKLRVPCNTQRDRYVRESTLLRVSLLPFLSVFNVFYLFLTSFFSYFVSVARITILFPKAVALLRYMLTRYDHILVQKNNAKYIPTRFRVT